MKTNGKVIVASLAILLIALLVACQSPKDDGSTTDQNESQNEKSDSVNKSDVEDDDTKNDDEKLDDGDDVNETQTNENENIQPESNNSTNNDIKISSGDEAVHFLKEQLEEGKNEDISFGTDNELLTDDKGSYYMVQLVDVPLRGSGKTGNLGHYKVYQDGTYELFRVELPDINHQEVYLTKLDDLTREIEQYRNNSDAT